MHISTILAAFTAVLAPVAVFAAPEPKRHHSSAHSPPYPFPSATGVFPTGTGTGTSYPTATGYYDFNKRELRV